MPYDPSQTVTEATRRSIFDALDIEGFIWCGRLTEARFLSRLFDLESLPSNDRRYDTAAEDVARHCESNDWPLNWIFSDERFDLIGCPDSLLFKFFAEMAHPVVQPEPEKVVWLIDVCNHYLAADGWILSKRGEISGRPTFDAERLTRPDREAANMAMPDDSSNLQDDSIEGMLEALADLFAYEGAPREVAVLANSTGEVEQSSYDNWNGGTYGYTLILKIPKELYSQIHAERESLQDSIKEKCKPFYTGNDHLEAVCIQPLFKVDPKWRDKAKVWLTGSGVTNQGRVRSDNIASRECDGLLFRSQPEINLYKALKAAGVSFAPLPVFIRGGDTYRRIELDFVIIKDGVVMVVEVDGDTVHLETPAEAHARTTMLVHEGAHVERIKASQCDTVEGATQVASYLVKLFDKLRASR